MKRPIPVLIALAMTATALPHGASAESIAVFTKNTTNPFSKAIRSGSDIAGKKFSVDISHYVPTTADSAAEQTKLVDDAIAKKPDIIVFDPVEIQKMVPAIEKINAANIPVIEITDRAEGGKFVSSVLPDDYQLGLATARSLLKALDGKENTKCVLHFAPAPGKKALKPLPLNVTSCGFSSAILSQNAAISCFSVRSPTWGAPSASTAQWSLSR